MTDTLIGATEAAEILGVSRATVSRWVTEEKLQPAQKMPGETGAYLFRRAEVERARREQEDRAEATS